MKATNTGLRALVLAFVVALITPVCVFAASTTPTWRGDDGSTYQQWTFDNDANPAAPPNVYNPYGTPSATITVGDFGEGWLDSLPGLGSMSGYWDLGSAGQISIDIPNRPGGAYKELWVLVTYFEDMTAAPAVTVQSQGQVSILDEVTFQVEAVDTGGAWMAYFGKWQIVPNPENERVLITGDMFGSIIDGIEIDTICVPEPTSLLSLLVGGSLLPILRRRRS